jgi:hypothetical protein
MAARLCKGGSPQGVAGRKGLMNKESRNTGTDSLQPSAFFILPPPPVAHFIIPAAGG